MQKLQLKIKVCGNRVLVKRADKVENKTQSGIYKPESAVYKPEFGTIIKCGDGDKYQEGDVIAFRRHSGTTFGYENEDYLLLRHEDIVGVFIGGKFVVVNQLIMVKFHDNDKVLKVGSLILERPDDYQYNLHGAVNADIVQVSRDIEWDKLTFRVKYGDVVALNYNLGAPIKINDVEHRLIRPEDILAIIGG